MTADAGVAERRFRVMGSDAHFIVVGGPPGLLDDAVRRVEQLEGRWSRFIETSEVSTLNVRAGTFVEVSTDTLELVRRALDAWRITGGAFDPTVLGAMIRAGYDRSFDELGPAPPTGSSLLGIGVADVKIDRDAVQLPLGTGFDPGGIGKGLAADLVCAEVLAGGGDGVCVNLGGDVRVSGSGPGGEAWTVGIEHPWAAAPIALVGLKDGAVATSTTLRRRWQTDGETRHHIIDPQTGLPSRTDLALASVVSAFGWVAEVLAKTVLLAGSLHPFDILGGTAAQALAVDDDGKLQATSGFTELTGGVPLPAVVPPPGLGVSGATW